MPDEPDGDGDAAAPLPFGIDASTGRPLPALSDDAIRAMAGGAADPLHLILSARSQGGGPDPSARASAVAYGIDAEALAEAGWGIVFGRSVGPEIKAALAPLIEHRRNEAGALFRIFEDGDAPEPATGARRWLQARGGLGLAQVNPEAGVPYYLLIVAAPEDIPFEFQYELGLFWAIGRLWFETAAEFGRYARSLVDQETGVVPPPVRELGLFATAHDFDRATQMLDKLVATPLDTGNKPIGDKFGFAHRAFHGGAATKAALTGLLGSAAGPPAVLFTGTHGMAFAADDARLPAGQGALVCADWTGYGAIDATHWFGASDVSADLNVAGMIHFMFACYGAGCPLNDNFRPNEREAVRIAPKPIVAALPQALLAHPRGSALAVIGHVERAWSYSFTNDFGSPQIQLFREILSRLMAGERVGQAVDAANTQWAVHAIRLSDLERDYRIRGNGSLNQIARAWIARDDARNLIVLGDPAVRLAR